MAAAMRCYRHPDRETYISCSECGRPICTECMTPAPVGQRCPEHSGKPQGVSRMRTGVRSFSTAGTPGLVTRTLIGINVGIYLIELATGGTINGVGSKIFDKGFLYGRHAGRAVSRQGALPPRLSRLGPRRVGGGARLDAERWRCRRLGRNLRDPR